MYRYRTGLLYQQSGYLETRVITAKANLHMDLPTGTPFINIEKR